MADNTQQMVRLLGLLRKQMNGAVADAMRYHGKQYGLNYGVSLITIRTIAGEHERDHSLALYLYKQQVRELRLAALHIADPSLLTAEEASTWAEGIINSEIAEEMAFALLRHSPSLYAIYTTWSQSEDEMIAYTALMAASRSDIVTNKEALLAIPVIIGRHSSSRIIAQGTVALLAAAAERDSEARKAVEQVLQQLPDSPAAQYVKEEMEWRLEVL